jgi:hypothetical protein
MQQILIGLSAAILLASCASGYKPQYHINEIVVVNNSREVVRDVSIRSSASGRMFACGNIAPLGICSDRFPRRNLAEGPVLVEWSLGGVRGNATLPAEVPASFATGLVVRGVLEINADGSVAGRFEQESPFR